jgi:excisionase family DNA binding protein
MKRMSVTVNEAILITGASRSAIFAAIRDGRLESYKLAGRRRRISVAALEKWLGVNIVLPTAA